MTTVALQAEIGPGGTGPLLARRPLRLGRLSLEDLFALADLVLLTYDANSGMKGVVALCGHWEDIKPCSLARRISSRSFDRPSARAVLSRVCRRDAQPATQQLELEVRGGR